MIQWSSEGNIVYFSAIDNGTSTWKILWKENPQTIYQSRKISWPKKNFNFEVEWPNLLLSVAAFFFLINESKHFSNPNVEVRQIVPVTGQKVVILISIKH